MSENEKLRAQIAEIKRRYAAQPKGWMRRFAQLMGYIAVMLDIPALLSAVERLMEENRQMRAMLNAAVRDIAIVSSEKENLPCPVCALRFEDAEDCIGCETTGANFAWRGLCEENQQCRVCGCTQQNTCPGGCSWVDYDLCSECTGKE